MTRDVVALIVSFVYVFASIGVAEGLRRWRGYSVDFTRKFIHIAVGMWAYGTVLLFERRTFAIIPPLAFVAINALSHFFGTFKAMETGEKWKLGTIYFPLAFAAIIWLFWERPGLLVASLMPMTWGDALAAVAGRRIGKHRYTILGNTRSLEGSAVMAAAGFVATLIPLVLIGQAGLLAAVIPCVRLNWFVPLVLLGQAGLLAALGVAAATALAATVVEAVSPWGIDNLTVPAVSAAVLALLLS